MDGGQGTQPCLLSLFFYSEKRFLFFQGQKIYMEAHFKSLENKLFDLE